VAVASLIVGAYVVRYGNRALRTEKVKTKRYRSRIGGTDVDQMRKWRDEGVLMASEQDLVFLEEIIESNPRHLEHLEEMVQVIRRAREEGDEEMEFRFTITEVADTASEPKPSSQHPNLELTTVYS